MSVYLKGCLCSASHFSHLPFLSFPFSSLLKSPFHFFSPSSFAFLLPYFFTSLFLLFSLLLFLLLLLLLKKFFFFTCYSHVVLWLNDNKFANANHRPHIMFPRYRLEGILKVEDLGDIHDWSDLPHDFMVTTSSVFIFLGTHFLKAIINCCILGVKVFLTSLHPNELTLPWGDMPSFIMHLLISLFCIFSLWLIFSPVSDCSVSD